MGPLARLDATREEIEAAARAAAHARSRVRPSIALFLATAVCIHLALFERPRERNKKNKRRDWKFCLLDPSRRSRHRRPVCARTRAASFAKHEHVQRDRAPSSTHVLCFEAARTVVVTVTFQEQERGAEATASHLRDPP